MGQYFIITFFVYALLMTIAGWILAKNKTVQDFLIAGRANHGFIMASGMFIGSMDTLWFIFFTGMAVSLGWGFSYIIIGVILGFLLLKTKINLIKQESTEHNMITLADWFRYRIGPLTGKSVAIFVVLGMFGWLIALFASSTILMADIFSISQEIVTLIMVLIAIPLLLKGGYASLTRFDVLQFCIVAICLILVYSIGFNDNVTLNFGTPHTLLDIGFIDAFSLCIGFVCGVFGAGDLWQRIFAVKTKDEGASGFNYAMLLFSLGFCSTAILGFTAASENFSGIPDDAFRFVFSDLLNESGKIIFLIILLAAITSTINVSTFGASSALANDFGYTDNDEKLKSRIKFAMGFVILLCAGVALLNPNLLQLGLAVISSPTCICGVLFLNLYTKFHIDDRIGFLSILSSGLIWLWLTATGNMTPETTAIPLVVNIAVAILGQRVYKLCK